MKRKSRLLDQIRMVSFMVDMVRIPGPFVKFLQECGVDAQYTMPGEPEQNGVTERRNRTLMDMVRSMMSNTSLPTFL